MSIFSKAFPKNEIKVRQHVFYNWHEYESFRIFSTPEKFTQSRWFADFFKNEPSLIFFGVYGKRKYINSFQDSRVKIFFSGEDLAGKRLLGWPSGYNRKFGDLCLKNVDLSLAFNFSDEKNYLRFPLWLTYCFSPEVTFDEIKKLIEKINNRKISADSRKKQCALITGKDRHGMRASVYEGLKNILEISCPSLFHHNTDELKKVYNDNKLLYLENFKFNICSENYDTNGYVSEKIFEAIYSGAIPIYGGSSGTPEPEIINPDAIITWKKDGDNSSAIELIKKLISDENAYEEFTNRPKFLPGAAERIWERFVALRNLIALTKKKQERACCGKTMHDES